MKRIVIIILLILTGVVLGVFVENKYGYEQLIAVVVDGHKDASDKAAKDDEILYWRLTNRIRRQSLLRRK